MRSSTSQTRRSQTTCRRCGTGICVGLCRQPGGDWFGSPGQCGEPGYRGRGTWRGACAESTRDAVGTGLGGYRVDRRSARGTREGVSGEVKLFQRTTSANRSSLMSHIRTSRIFAPTLPRGGSEKFADRSVNNKITG